jgi:orotate phosphoribosyltransferase
MCEISNIKFSTNIWNACIPLSIQELKELNNEDSVGAITMKTSSLYPIKGNPNDWELYNWGSFNNISLHNNGISETVRKILLIKPKKPVFVSVYGTPTDIKNMLPYFRLLSDYKILLEWNISCPNDDSSNYNSRYISPHDILEIKRLFNIPVGVKIGMDFDQETDILRNVDFIVAVNSMNGKGGTTIKWKALDFIHKLVKNKFGAPIIGVGGIENTEDIKRFLHLGVVAVEVATAYLKHGISFFRNINNLDIVSKLYENNIIKKGEFTLKCGEKSTYYIDMRKIPSKIKLWKDIVLSCLEDIKDLEFDCVCGVPTGAVPLASVLAYRMNKKLILVRKERKQHGIDEQIIGDFEAKEKCLVIEDVVTTGTSLQECCDILTSKGLITIPYTVVNRGTKNIKSLVRLREEDENDFPNKRPRLI